VHRATQETNEKAFHLLLRLGYDVSVLDGDGDTALQIATSNNSIEYLSLLLEHWARTFLVGRMSGHALQAASTWGNTDAVRILVQHGARIDAEGSNHCTALIAAVTGFGT
jgi:ankyrin repeat protein